MDEEFFITALFIIFCCGLCLGIAILWLIHRIKLGHFKTLASSIIAKAEKDAEALMQAQTLHMKQQLIENQREIESLWQSERRKIQREEERLLQREDKLEERVSAAEKKIGEIEKRENLLTIQRHQLDNDQKHLADEQKKLRQDLESRAGISSATAKEQLFQQVHEEIASDIALITHRLKNEAMEKATKNATSIIVTAINRLAVSCASEATVCTVSIPNEEMKGRIIGREGRNVRTFEQVTGVNVIIDDTPGLIILSGFDPIRKQIARLALMELVADGRIHPTRIEEVVIKAKETLNQQIHQYGEDAALRIGAINIHPELLILLGKLKLRYSYGQNVLDHSLEVAHLMGLMAAELGLNIAMAKRIGLLHDIGKALSHEMSGSHAVLGCQIALKYGESKEIANGIGCHHDEMESITIEGSLCSAADALSASRLGARLEAIEDYITRLKKLEEIAYGFPGVEKAYALQAGREIRVTVLPDMIDDTGIFILGKNLTKKVEEELSYPGKVKVTIIREKQAISYAS